MKNKIGVLFILIIIIAIIIVYGVLVYNWGYKTGKKPEYTSENTTEDSILTVANDEDSEEVSEEKRIAIEEIKTKLKDKKWIKENLYLTQSSTGEKEISGENQKVKFVYFENKNEQAPIVVLKVECEEQQTIQLLFVTYKNGDIVIKKLYGSDNNSHIKYYASDSENLVMQIYADSTIASYKLNKISIEYGVESIEANAYTKENDYNIENVISKNGMKAIENDLNTLNIERFFK